VSGPRIAVLNYGMGNIRSAYKALLKLGAQAEVTGDLAVAETADGLVLPGDGAFPRAVAGMRSRGFERLLPERLEAGVPVLGICIGMQILFDGSEELGGAEGLGLLPGPVRALQPRGEKLPQIGWSRVSFTRPSRLTEGLGEEAAFYHVHSFAPEPSDPEVVIGTAEFGGAPFASAVERGGLWGVQFHPEKSSADGLRLIGNFIGVCARAAERRAIGAPA
jgi:glutamine amidotransferase